MEKPLIKFALLLIFVSGIFCLAFILIPKSRVPAPSVPEFVQAGSQITVREDITQSPDGTYKLTMKRVKDNGWFAYTFLVSPTGGGTAVEVYKRTAAESDRFSVPANSFSPDNKFVFIKENAPGNTNYWVMSASGKPLPGGSQAQEISSLFAAKYENYKITDVTGWGGLNLIIINTSQETGAEGPSFWFDLTSSSFIRLSSRFN